MRQRPFVPITALFALGVFLACASAHPAPLIWPSLFSVVLAFLGWRMPAWRPWCVGAMLVCLGFARLTQLVQLSGPLDLRAVVKEESTGVGLRGRIVVTPWLRLQDRAGQSKARTLLVLEALEMRPRAQWERAEGRVLVSLDGELKRVPRTGSLVEFEGALSKPQEALLEGLFDYERHLAWQGIHFQLRAASGAEPKLLAEPASRYGVDALADAFLPWAQRILALGLPEEDDALRLLWGMTLGWKTALTSEVSEPFMRTGTLHVFAISGLHIALMAGMLVAALRVVRIPRQACGWVVIPWIWFYTAATGWQASAIRSTIMMTVIVVGWMLKRPSDLVNSLAAAGFFILVWDARQLFTVSFQLSFLAVLSLALMAQPLQRWFHERLRPDPLRPESTISVWERCAWVSAQWVATAFATSLAAWIGCLPLTLFYFHLASPVGLLANVVVVPLSSLALMCNLGAILTGEWFPWATELLNHSAWLWLTMMVKFCRWCAAWRWGWFYVPPPPWWIIVVSLALMVLWGLGGWQSSRRRRWGFAVAIAGIGGSAILLIREGWTSRLTLPALRGGFAVVVDQPGRKGDLVVDAGGTLDGQFTLVPLLRLLGYNSLPVVALSHGDARHVGGVPALVESVPVERMAIPETGRRSRSLQSALQAVEARPVRALASVAGVECGAWKVIFPRSIDKRLSGDDQPAVLAGEMQGLRVLIVPDLSVRGQSQLLESRVEVRADLLVASPPAKGEPLEGRLLDAAMPRYVLFHDLDGRVSTETVRRLKRRLAERGIQAWFTSECGSLTLEIRRRQVQVRPRRPSPRQPPDEEAFDPREPED